MVMIGCCLACPDVARVTFVPFLSDCAKCCFVVLNFNDAARGRTGLRDRKCADTVERQGRKYAKGKCESRLNRVGCV